VSGESSNEAGNVTSEEDGEVVQPTPPDSPTPSTGAFAPCLTAKSVDLEGEFYAIEASKGVFFGIFII